MGIEEAPAPGIILSSVEAIAQFGRGNSQWPVTMGLACCAIEMMASAMPRFDMARFGLEVFRASPRHADLMLVSGRLSHRMAPVVRNIYDELADPKWVIAFGVCASSGGMFNNYAVVQGVDHVVPVDIYLPGCPPRPEMVINDILELRKQIKSEKLGANRKAVAKAAEEAALKSLATHEMKGLLA